MHGGIPYVVKNEKMTVNHRQAVDFSFQPRRMHAVRSQFCHSACGSGNVPEAK
jgi:hypothetical protein